MRPNNEQEVGDANRVSLRLMGQGFEGSRVRR